MAMKGQNCFRSTASRIRRIMIRSGPRRPHESSPFSMAQPKLLQLFTPNGLTMPARHGGTIMMPARLGHGGTGPARTDAGRSIMMTVTAHEPTPAENGKL